MVSEVSEPLSVSTLLLTYVLDVLRVLGILTGTLLLDPKSVLSSYAPHSAQHDYGMSMESLLMSQLVIPSVLRAGSQLPQQPFTSNFPRADIHELLSCDLLHQVIKGTFKDHLVTWVEDYLKKKHGKSAAAKIMSDIDRR